MLNGATLVTLTYGFAFEILERGEKEKKVMEMVIFPNRRCKEDLQGALLSPSPLPEHWPSLVPVSDGIYVFCFLVLLSPIQQFLRTKLVEGYRIFLPALPREARSVHDPGARPQVSEAHRPIAASKANSKASCAPQRWSSQTGQLCCCYHAPGELESRTAV